jgi:antitoxin MazE
MVMRINIRKIGNSRGILIPSAFLRDCGIGDHVDILMEGKALIIRPIHEPRAGWFEAFNPEMDVEPLGELPVDEGDGDWTW